MTNELTSLPSQCIECRAVSAALAEDNYRERHQLGRSHLMEDHQRRETNALAAEYVESGEGWCEDHWHWKAGA